jgi:hypothetical protein
MALGPLGWSRSDTVTLSGADVTAWPDKSGNGNDWGSTAGKRMTYDAAGALPKLVATSAGNQHLTRAAYPKPSAYHHALVVDYGATVASKVLYSAFYDAHAVILETTAAPVLVVNHQAVGAVTSALAPPATLALLEWGWTGTHVRVRLNGGAWASHAVASISGTTPGAAFLNAWAGGTACADIDGLYEHLYLDRTPTDAELLAHRNYVTARYGV